MVMEPHKKFKPDRSGPEMHFHVVFRMRNNFAHLQITKWLANHAGCRGHMSYPRKGWKEMVRYVLEDSAVKLPVHMDQTPYFWPDEDKTMTKEKMLEKVGTSKEEEEKKEKAKKDEEFKEQKKEKEPWTSLSSLIGSSTTRSPMRQNIGCWQENKKKRRTTQRCGTMVGR